MERGCQGRIEEKINDAELIEDLKAIAVAEKEFREGRTLSHSFSNVFKNYHSERIGKFRVVFSIKKKALAIAKMEHRKTTHR